MVTAKIPKCLITLRILKEPRLGEATNDGLPVCPRREMTSSAHPRSHGSGVPMVPYRIGPVLALDMQQVADENRDDDDASAGGHVAGDAANASPRHPLNWKLHDELLRRGAVRASTFDTAMSALESVRAALKQRSSAGRVG